MGCQQSKSATTVNTPVKTTNAAVRDQTSELKTTPVTPASPMSTGSYRSVNLPREVARISDPGKRLFTLLKISLQKKDDLVWSRVVKICEKTPQACDYIEPKTKDTPLHLACRVLTAFPFDDDTQVSPLDAIRVMIRCLADIVGRSNASGYIPLHDAIRPLAHSLLNAASLHMHSEVLNLLIAADYEASTQYLSRNDVVFDPDDGACTPLYHAVASIPDDFAQPPGPSVAFISAIHFPCPQMVSVKNASNYDKPLALLYRRFSRQFDHSEKFFPGDNSKEEIVRYRHMYKTAAMNTWKVIVALLDPLSDKRKSVSDFFMVHAAVRMDTPPDLLRYIIETRPEEVRQANEQGRLPLHVAAACPKEQAGNRYHFKFVVDELLYSYPDAAAATDADDKLPLQLAVDSGKYWIGGGLKSLYDVYPDAMEMVNMDENPLIRSALSFSTNFAEEHASDEKKVQDSITKEEHYDAIMMVQKSDAVLGDVISAMWANEEDAGIQMLGCMTLSQMAEKCKGDSAKLNIIALNAVTTIVNAMKNHPNEPAVQEKASCALRLLAPADNYREVSFAASGAAAAIVGAMQAHVSDSIVQKEACSALRNIVKYGGPDRATVIASVSGFTALQNALGAHPDDAAVQREACLTLESLTGFKDAHLPDLPGSQTAPLLEAAAKNHPEECQKIAEIVLSRLS
jgi:hypothetical protein